MPNTPFQIFAWLALAVFAGESLLAKFVSKHKIKNPWLFNIVWVYFVVMINSVICIWAGAGVPKDWRYVIWAGIFFALSMGLFIFAAYNLDISVFIPLENFRTVFAVILGTIFLGEILFSWQAWLIVIMVLAGILVSIDEKFSIKSFVAKGVILAMAGNIALALWAVFVKKAAVENDFWTLNLWYSLIGALLMTLTWPFFSKDVKTLDKSQVGYVSVMAIAGTVGNLASAKAYSSNISISSAIISIPISVMIVMILAPFYPRLFEHHTWRVYALRIAAAAILVYAGLKLT